MIDFFNANDSSEIEAVDVIHNSPCVSNQDYVFSLMHAIISRLRFVDLQNISLKVDDLSLQAPERTRSGHSNKYFCTEPPIENITFQNVGVDEAVRSSESDAVFKEWANSQIEECVSIRPRQFVYDPSNPSSTAFGTLDQKIAVINHEKGNLVGYIPYFGTVDSILGLLTVNSTTVYVNSDCEQYRQKLIKNEDEHETFFIKVGSPGSAYASPAFYAKKDIISGVLLIWFCSKGHEQLNECAIFKGDPFRVCSLCYTL
ncbi:hypothetical protein LguiB_020888 [Lonicera macranthoides]